MSKEEMEKFIKTAGKPVKFGGYLSSLSVTLGWTDELFDEYVKYFGSDSTVLTAASFGYIPCS
jgi:ribonucleotide reductase beta subunit family protein with ferritin-like domain